jgi:hypothetical protein
MVLRHSHKQPRVGSLLPGAEKPLRDLQQLLDEIGSGSIVDADELGEQDIRLLRGHYGEGEELQDLFDRLRWADGEVR